MLNPAHLNLTVWRNAPFPTDVQFAVPLDLTGRRFIMQVRLYDGAPGSPLLTISSDASSGDRIEVIEIDTEKPETIFAIRLGKGTHESLPAAGKAGASATFRHDILVGPTSFEEVLAFGNYTLNPGVTR